MIKLPRFHLASWSTFGQTALLIVAGLLVAQFVGFFLMRDVIDQWQRSYVEQPIIRRFVDVARAVGAAPPARRQQIADATGRVGEQFWLTQNVRFSPFGRQSDVEQRLSDALKKDQVAFTAVIASRRGFHGRRFGSAENGRPPVALPQWADGGPPRGGQLPRSQLPPGDGLSAPDDLPMPPGEAVREPGGAPMDFGGPHPIPQNRGWQGLFPMGDSEDEIRLAALLPSGEWLVGRFQVQRAFPLFLNPIFVSQTIVFLILLAGMLFWASRISHPLRILARAAAGLQPQEQFQPMPVHGPRDVQVAIASFNAMALRVRELLQEKDRMLSAIGHDLRTPLAALRIRAESIEPDADRERFVESIEDMTKMVEEILGLARLGQSTEPRELVDVSALADSVVEEFRELGQDVSFAEAPRTPLTLQVGAMRRLLRNLVDNAVKYGEKAHVTLIETAATVELSVDDEGPGIPPERLGEVIQPFTRLETSRSRRTGGIGLGLSIADAIARSQGAVLVLENRAAGGLRATVRWTK